MITFKSFLLEAFDKPYAISFTEGEGPNDVMAYFKDDEGESTLIYFSEYRPGLYTVDFKRKGSFDILNDGPKDRNQGVKIMATIIDAMKKFNTREKPKYIAFTSKGEDTSRGNLYSKLVNRFAKAEGFEDVTDKIDYLADEETRKWFQKSLRSNREYDLTLLAKNPKFEEANGE